MDKKWSCKLQGVMKCEELNTYEAYNVKSWLRLFGPNKVEFTTPLSLNPCFKIIYTTKELIILTIYQNS